MDITNTFFTVPRSYIAAHIYDNSSVLTKEESIKRITWLIIIFGIFTSSSICFLIGLTISISSKRYITVGNIFGY